MAIREAVEREAGAAAAAAAALDDDAVATALTEASVVLRERRREVLSASAADVEAATGTLDAGTIDRLRLDERRLDDLERQVRATAAMLRRPRQRAVRRRGEGAHERDWLVSVIGGTYPSPCIARGVDVPGSTQDCNMRDHPMNGP